MNQQFTVVFIGPGGAVRWRVEQDVDSWVIYCGGSSMHDTDPESRVLISNKHTSLSRMWFAGKRYPAKDARWHVEQPMGGELDVGLPKLLDEIFRRVPKVDTSSIESMTARIVLDSPFEDTTYFLSGFDQWNPGRNKKGVITKFVKEPPKQPLNLRDFLRPKENVHATP